LWFGEWVGWSSFNELWISARPIDRKSFNELWIRAWLIDRNSFNELWVSVIVA
jgi:hypothetical protein